MNLKYACGFVLRHGSHQFSVVLAYTSCIGMCGPKGYGFIAMNRVYIEAILVIDGVWFLHSSLELDMYLRRSYLFISIEKPINKYP